MLGASHYVASLATRPGAAVKSDPKLKELIASLASISPDRLAGVPLAMSRESLTPVVRRMLLFDLPSIVCPARQSRDRGRSLEQAWIANTEGTLGWPLSALAKAEAAGLLPSLVITPMTERGEFLLMSNLELDGLAGGRDFFQFFPYSQPTLTLATAVRMNSAFPIVTPSVSLPARFADRVGDAGYLDNYGIWLSSEWIWKNRGWLTSYTSGVILLQIRAYPNTVSAAPTTLVDRFSVGMHWLTSPLDLVLGGRYAMMEKRNQEAVRKLDEYFNLEHAPKFFQHVVLESGYAAVPLSWSLTTADRERLDVALRSDTQLSWSPGKQEREQIESTRQVNLAQIRKLCDILPAGSGD